MRGSVRVYSHSFVWMTSSLTKLCGDSACGTFLKIMSTRISIELMQFIWIYPNLPLKSSVKKYTTLETNKKTQINYEAVTECNFTPWKHGRKSGIFTRGEKFQNILIFGSGWKNLKELTKSRGNQMDAITLVEYLNVFAPLRRSGDWGPNDEAFPRITERLMLLGTNSQWLLQNYLFAYRI